MLEIMLVLGIMAIVLSMGLPAIVRTLERDPLHQAVHDLEEVLGHARALAILEGTEAEMVLSADGTVRASLAPRTSPASRSPSPVPSEPVEPVPAEPFRAVLGQDVAITALSLNLAVVDLNKSEVRVRFHPNGTSDDFSVRLTDASGEVEIVLDPVTGTPDVKVLR